jgi:glycosyltransferase involved in cell wall biosynthesis
MLTLALDTSPLALTRAGTARHLRGLLAGLGAADDVRVEEHSFPGRGRLLVPARDLGWYLWALPLVAARADVLHCPTFRAPLRAPLPVVATFHDLAVLRHPETFNAWTRSYSRLVLPGVAANAARLIAVSEFTAAELVELLGVDERKIRVIPNAVGEPFTAEGDAAPGNYIVAVSTLEPRKNLAGLIEGFRRADLDGCELRVVGARGWGGIRVASGGENVRWLGEVPDAELARLYRGARCAAYLSLYEGFGLPVLEAMACGTAVVSSDLPAVREFGRGVVTVDGTDPDAIAAGFRSALAQNEELGREGQAAAAAYRWDRVARETVAVYRELVA